MKLNLKYEKLVKVMLRIGFVLEYSKKDRKK